GGEINCLDPGGYGALTITKSIIISCEAGTAGGLVSGTYGVVVSVAAADVGFLRGLAFGGLRTGPAGIHFINAGGLDVRLCLIRHFNAGAASGINFVPTGAAELYVSDTYLTDNGVGNTGAGVLIQPTGTAKAVLSNIHADNNVSGVRVYNGGPGTLD